MIRLKDDRIKLSSQSKILQSTNPKNPNADILNEATE